MTRGWRGSSAKVTIAVRWLHSTEVTTHDSQRYRQEIEVTKAATAAVAGEESGAVLADRDDQDDARPPPPGDRSP